MFYLRKSRFTLSESVVLATSVENTQVGTGILKYVPQVVLNIRRRSTTGWTIWNVILDLTGGFLSVVQVSTETTVPWVHFPRLAYLGGILTVFFCTTIYYLARVMDMNVFHKLHAGELFRLCFLRHALHRMILSFFGVRPKVTWCEHRVPT